MGAGWGVLPTCVRDNQGGLGPRGGVGSDGENSMPGGEGKGKADPRLWKAVGR